MLRRSMTVMLLTVMVAGVGVAPSQAADAAPSQIAVRRLAGLPPAGDGSTLQAQSAEPGRVSEPVEAPIAFQMVGFEVPSGWLDDHGHAGVDFRTSSDGATWTRWTEVEVALDEGPDSPTIGDTSFSEPVWTDEARYVQARTTSGTTRDVAVHLIDATGASRSLAARTVDAVRAAVAPAATPAVAATGQPRIVSRAEWGADESIRRGSASYASDVSFGVVHHTAGTNGYSRSQAPAVVRGVYAYHVLGRGWRDIGYQFLVDRFGTIYEGRHGGVTRPVIGAHAGGFNLESFGVSLMGDYSSASVSSAQREALVDLLAWKLSIHGVDPLGTVHRTSGGSSRYPSGTVVRLDTLSGHRDVSLTSCPAGVHALLGSLRSDVAAAMAPDVAAPVVDVVTRVGDGDSVTEMLLGIARAAFSEPGSAGHAVVARDDVFADALAGGPLAGTQGPILFTPTDRLDRAVRDELERVLPAGRTVYLLGGRAALSRSVEDDLRRTWRVERLQGANRFATAVAIADEVRARSGDERIMVARSGPDRAAPWADAVAAGAWGARHGVPLLLTPSDHLHADTAAALRRWGSRRSIALGGPAALSQRVLDAMPAPVRVAGSDRAGTSADIARRMWMRRSAADQPAVALADGYRADAWKPALAASPLAARLDMPLLLTRPTELSGATAAYLSSLGFSSANRGRLWAIGTRWRISSDVADAASRRMQ